MVAATALTASDVVKGAFFRGKTLGSKILIVLSAVLMLFGQIAFWNNSDMDPRGCDEPASARVITQAATPDTLDICTQDTILDREIRSVDPTEPSGSRIQIDVTPNGKIVLRR